MKSLTHLLLVVVLLFSTQAEEQATKNQPLKTSTPPRPNIVLIFIDDMGYGDIGPFGNNVNQTPHLDRMAAEGNTLRQFYVANTACTPSRAALLTGTYAHRIGMDGTVTFPGEDRGLNPNEITIAEMLKEAGYNTGIFGKWHLGDQKAFLPLAQGFDQYFGIPYSNDMWPGNMRGNPVTDRGPYEPLPVMLQNEAVAYVADGADQSLLAEAITDAVVEFIREDKDQPFFCYVPHSHVHKPRYARPDFMERAEGDVDRATVEEVDDSVGRILDTIRELKLDENTLVIFTSDNGGAGGMSMGPLRGGKGGPKFEGHMRVPTVTWWPGRIAAGMETDAIAVTTDILPSLARLTGAKVPDDRPIDGKDALDVILGTPGAKSPHEVHYYEVEGIRRGDWKLVKVPVKDKGIQPQLFDLSTDLGEQNNVAKDHPDLVKELENLLTKHADSIAAETRPAAFVDNATPILAEPGDLPRLRDYIGKPGIKAASEAPPKKGAAAKLGTKNLKPETGGSAARPNVLFIAIDDMNDWTTLFDDDNPIQTPNLKRLADRGAFFSRAYCAVPACNPSRTAILTGLAPTTSGVYSNSSPWKQLLPDVVTLPQFFSNHGYRTDGAGKIFHHGGTGTDRQDKPSFQAFQKLNLHAHKPRSNYNGYTREDGHKQLASASWDWGVHDVEKQTDEYTVNYVTDVMRTGKKEEPLFLAAGIFRPHLPFWAPPETFERYPFDGVELPPRPEDDLDDVPPLGVKMSRKEAFIFDNAHPDPENRPGSLKKMVQCYQAASDYADEMVGRLIDELDATGRADNTIIVLWSDHGYHLGDKNACVKFTLWEKANRVPFIIVAPGVTQPGTVIDRPVSLLDIYPTLADLAGLEVGDHLDGNSLVTLLKNPEAEWSEPAIMTQGKGNHAVRSDRWRYICYSDGTEELYDHQKDPWEWTNLAGQSEYAPVIAEHRKWVPVEKAEKELPRVTQKPKPKPANQPTTKAPEGHPSDPSDLILADFEGSGFGQWTTTGDAFGAGPVTKGTSSNRLEPFIGAGLANSYRPNDKPTGTLNSPEFKLERDYLHFLIGGGNHPDETGIHLLIDDKPARTATGLSKKNEQKQEVMVWHSWDITEFKGREARVEIFDHRTGGWGHIQVDHIFQSDRSLEEAKPVSITLKGTPASPKVSRAAAAPKAPAKPAVTPPTSSSFSPPPKPGVTLKDEWSTFPLYDQVGYDQPQRPQFHFTSRMGWLNDPNGMVYCDGEWHMLFQHNAKGNPSATKSWGNAVSPDLIYWQQLPHAINPYPKVDGSDGVHAIWSGSAVVDVNNALGKQKGDTKTIFALYSATHDKFFQGGAYSTDKGRTWTKINDGKPVIPHQEGFSKGQRDPRVFYFAPGDFYVTIMMIGGPDRLVRLWKSTNLLDWEIIGDIPNKAAECIDMYAVPVDGDPENMRWIISDAGAHYEIGEFDGKTWKGYGAMDADNRRLKFDYGDAWYAAQAFNQGPDGRVVHVGWLRAKQPGYRPFLEANMPFNQQMSFPIEITLKTTPNGIEMFRNPVQEIEKLYAITRNLKNLSATKANEELSDLLPELIDLNLKFSPEKDFTLDLRGLKILFDAEAQEFEFTNTARVEGERAAWNKSGPYRDNGIRRIPAPTLSGQVTLRALVDRASLELFINDGAAAASFVVVPDPANRRIAIEGNEDLKIHSLVVHELKSAWGNGVAPVPVEAELPKTPPPNSIQAVPTKAAPVKAPPTKKLKPVRNPRSPGDRPNVVVIFMDDMGYGDIGPFGSDHPTPNLDRMAAEGLKLTDFYVSSTACTPSRSALLTGCYADRLEMGRGVVFPADERGLNPDEITIADLLKQGGYATGCFGKWHLGDQPEFMPLAQGFDEYQGIPYSNDMWVNGNKKHHYPPLPWIVQNAPVAHIPDAESQARITDAITDAAVEFIIRHQDEPFFAYVPHSATHSPHMVTPERLEAAGGDVMRALIGEIDHSTGRILDTLRQLALDENTFVLFTNDNGGSGKTSSGPLRGHKFGPKYEGHMRVSTLAWWPGKIPAASVTSEICATIDLLPSIASITGLTTPNDRILDGHDISDILLGNQKAQSPHEILFYESGGARRDNWKLIHYPAKNETITELYNFETDIGEENNIAERHPDIVTDLIAALESHIASIAEGIRPAGRVENPKPLLSNSNDVPTLVEYLNSK